jgi:hypothetical protein
MDRKKVILLVCALLIAAVTAFMARSMFCWRVAPQGGCTKARRHWTKGHRCNAGIAGWNNHDCRFHSAINRGRKS